MTGFVRPIATLALSLAVISGCGGAPPVVTPTARPTETEDVSTVAPNPTTAEPAATPVAPTDSTGLMDPAVDWPTTVTVTLSTGRFVDEFAQGTFTSARTARNCENDMLSPRGFGFGFPHDAEGADVEDVSFGAQELLPGTSTSSFNISVSISAAAAGGLHPLTSLDPSDPKSGASGTAQLSVAAGGARTLVVDVADKDGVSIRLTAICSPK